MKKIILIALAVCNIVIAQTLSPNHFDGQLYVKFKFDVISNQENLINANDYISQTIVNKYHIHKVTHPFKRATFRNLNRVVRIYFDEISLTNDLISELKQTSLIEYIEPVRINKHEVVPNDLGPISGSGNQYSLHLINAQMAWDLSLGDPSIKVAIVDDAVLRTHPDLTNSVWNNMAEISGVAGVDDDANGYIDDFYGYDVADNDNNVNPNTSSMTHGTHVAGIVGATTDNNIGVASIGYGVSIMCVKSSNTASVITNAYEGVYYAADAGADVVNMSWGGGGGPSTTEQDVLDYAYSRGCVLIAAAGNDNVDTEFYPAAYNHVISVASSTSTDLKSSFSNYGTWIDVTAPGSSILSTVTGDTYAENSGTSMASPMVAGLCGLMLSYYPSLTQVQVENCLLSGCESIDAENPSFIGELGAGRINALNSLQCITALLSLPPVALANSDVQSVCPATNIQFFGNSNVSVGNTFQWLFPGGIPSSSTLQNPVVSYPAVGFYDVTLIVTNSFGVDTIVLDNYININSTSYYTQYIETFESGSFASTGWTTNNPDGLNTWDIFTTAGTTPGNKSAGVNIFNNQAAAVTIDELISPSFNFSTNTNTLLSFEHAHRRRVASVRDSLIVLVSSNGGVTWNSHLRVAENGSGSFATNFITTSNFVPTGPQDWCFTTTTSAPCFSIDLSAYDGQSDVRIKFIVQNRGGNNIYLDNIKIEAICTGPPDAAPVAMFSANENTICEGESVTYDDLSAYVPTSWNWSFPGGTPASSTAENPVVLYNTAGNYDVQLIVTNAFGGDTIITLNYVTVLSNPAAPTISFSGGVLTSSYTTGNQWLLNGVPISGATSNTYTPTVNGTYTVIHTNAAGCASSASQPIEFNSASVEDYLTSLITIYPNPTEDIIYLNTSNLDVESIAIYDALGKLLETHSPKNSFSLSSYASGFYYLKVTLKTGKSAVMKCIKK